ncbi:Na+-transporting NADH:ubiquinone oxidoreductase subunit C [Proteiniborus ethanoligenes]|uniref:Ion-translocating oxidoreductase complex subunit G n=1 Tax=Proteiniborus ethanoligenes TaxID=415015 RepID=A0A1H3SDQ0_9FIRM|nr:FMN-binding protein [Proteiniborus ethanoligenes]SDZ36193.1 Na+-transporting NADH:ubiquinone oxidoreductase subunit C [Proteiniborus ethanoligenes]
MKKSFSFPIVFMIIITAFFTAILAFLNYSTADVITYNQETELRKTLLYVFNIEPPSHEPKILEETFNKYISKENLGGQIVYTAKKDNEIIGYAFPINGSGLWGSVEGFAAISKDFSELLGIDFVSHSETPGLGGRISEDWFKKQFRGLKLTDVNDGNYIVYKPAAGGNVDAIAGATLTSKSVSKFINEDIDEFIKENKGGK